METRLYFSYSWLENYGFCQGKYIHLHQVLKMKYRKKDCALMLQKLKDNPGKVPLPDRNEMLKILNDAKKELMGTEQLNQYRSPTLSVDQRIIWYVRRSSLLLEKL